MNKRPASKLSNPNTVTPRKINDSVDKPSFTSRPPKPVTPKK